MPWTPKCRLTNGDSRAKAKSIDDALELLDLLMTTELLGRAQRESEGAIRDLRDPNATDEDDE